MPDDRMKALFGLTWRHRHKIHAAHAARIEMQLQTVIARIEPEKVVYHAVLSTTSRC